MPGELVQAAVTWEHPRDTWELSRARYEEALRRVEEVLQRDWGENSDLLNEMRIIRMVGMHRVPWWGMGVDPNDSSVMAGTMLRNCFEALGDSIDYPTDRGLETRAAHWLTRRYLPLWCLGKREYENWLDTLFRKLPEHVDRPPG